MNRYIRLSFFILTLAIAQPAVARVKLLRQQSLSSWHIQPANYSGITPLGNDRYAVVDDKSATDGFYIFTIRLHQRSGRVRNVSCSSLIASSDSLKPKADCEDIVFCPADTTLFIAQEGSCSVVQYTMEGQPTGRTLTLPDNFRQSNMQHNAGFEALAYDTILHRFFLTTEQPLLGDSLHRLAIISPLRNDMQQLPYRIDNPELTRKPLYYAHGIAAMTYLSDDRLLVMERELCVPRRYLGGKCRIKIYSVDLNEQDITPTKGMTKQLVASFTTHISRLNYANYEGMCVGPTLEDGRRTLLLINDSQGGVHNGPFHLKDYLKVIILDH